MGQQTLYNDLLVSGNITLNNLFINGNRPIINGTGVLLSGEATTQAYVTGISGNIQTQINTLNSQTGTYVLKIETGNFITNSQTGQFYRNSNPSGFITGIDLSSYATRNYVTGISGELQSQINSLTGSSNTITIEDSNTIIGLSIFL